MITGCLIKYGWVKMTREPQKICERCNRNFVYNGTSLCDKCYEEHNEIYGITQESLQHSEATPKNRILNVGIALSLVGLLVVFFILSIERPVVEQRYSEQLDYESFLPSGAVIYINPDYQYQKLNGVIKINGAQDHASIVKVVDLNTLDNAYEVFVQPNQSAEIPLVIGTYIIYVASGTNWINSQEHFGASTKYFMLDKVVEISLSEDDIIGEEIWLQSIAAGNLRTIKKTRRDW